MILTSNDMATLYDLVLKGMGQKEIRVMLDRYIKRKYKQRLKSVLKFVKRLFIEL